MRSIRQKLFAGFGVVLVVFGVAWALTAATMADLDHRAQEVGTRDLEAVAALGDTRTGIMTMRAASLDTLNLPLASASRSPTSSPTRAPRSWVA